MTERGNSSRSERRIKQQQQNLVLVPSSSFSSSPLLLPPTPVTVVVGEVPPNYCPYPPPLAKYEDVVRNAKLFMDTLEKLHATMGTKFMIPTIGGKELDLHRLFVEVTSRGGLEKVIRDRRWKDVTAVFSFPSTATNASFVLRKYYVSLLHNYEQIYFFGARGWTAPAVPQPTPSPVPPQAQGSAEPFLRYSEAQATSRKRTRSTSGESLPRASSSPVGCPVAGVIDGKFEHGYLVTVTVGTEKLKGVLYHVPEYSVAQMPHYTATANPGGKVDAATSGVRRRRRRKKSEIRKRDPYRPKPNRSGYNFFFAEQHARLKPLHPGKDREISKMIGELWNNLSETDKAVYQERGVKDKERYRSEMEEYRERLKMGPIIRDAVPLQQRRAVPEAMPVDMEPKEETEEEVFPGTPGNDSSSEESDSEEKIDGNEDSSEAEESPETEPAMLASNLVAERDATESERNLDGRKESEATGDLNLDSASESTKKESPTNGH